MADRGDSVTGGDIGTKGVMPSDEFTDSQPHHDTGSEPKYRYESRAADPGILRRTDGFVTQDEADRMLEASQAAARRAGDAFKEACEATSEDQAEASFQAAKHKLEEVWNYAHLRNRPFRDLLGLLTAAIKRAELADINEGQRDVLRLAFLDLRKLFLDDDIVEQHIDRFADHAVDNVISPLRATTAKRVKLVIEEMD